MNDLNDKEMIKVRLRFLDLIKSFFINSPDSERLSRWRGTFAALIKDKITPEIDKAARELNSQLTEKKLEQLQDEFYSLFTDPFAENHLNMMASHYIDGRNHGDTLIALRQFFYDSKIKIEKSVNQPEDSLPIMLDALITLIEEAKNGPGTYDKQRELVNDFLIPSTELIFKAATDNETAHFFEACLSFCKSYLALEKSLAA